MIIYKVVKREKYSRINHSCCAYGKYELEYIRGKTTKALPGTVIMCFKIRGQAQIFIGQLARLAPLGYGCTYEIIRVESIGKRICLPFYTSRFSSQDLDAFYKSINKIPEGKQRKTYICTIGYEPRIIHPGTICFSAVKVLDR